MLLFFLAASSGLEPVQIPKQATKRPKSETYLFTPPGFQKEGTPITASRDRTGRLEITVRDKATGKPTFCRMNVVGPDGNFYQPKPNYLSPYALTGQWPAPGSWGNRAGKAPFRYIGRFFYSWGETDVDVPPGPVRVEVWKGLEHRQETLPMEVVAGESRKVEIQLERTVTMAEQGYYSGDLHIHIPRQTDRDDQIIFDLLSAEDIRFATILGYNQPAGRYVGLMNEQAAPQFRGLGARSVARRGEQNIISGQEYRSSTYGHLNLYLRSELISPGQNLNADNWPIYGNIGRETQELGGYAIHAHGGYAQEIYADAAQGVINAVELLQFGVYRGIGLSDWYHMLNTGYRLPCVAGSDYPACRTLGDSRTYVYRDKPPTFLEWLRGAVSGNSFVTTGPMLLLEVDGKKPGAIIQIGGRGQKTEDKEEDRGQKTEDRNPLHATTPPYHTLTARLRVRSEVTPVTNLEIVVNGKVVTHKQVDASAGQGQWLELSCPVEVNESSWIAARAYSTSPVGKPDAEAHTNPIYVYMNGKPPYCRASLDTWIERVDKQIAIQTKRTFAEKSKVLTYLQRSRDLLLKIRADGGLPAGADPAKIAKEMEADSLAADGSIRNPTEKELKEFLKPVPPKSPAEALKTFETADGFEMQLVAAEPMVFSPVAAAFDEDGNLYVAEMRDYPYKPLPGKQPIGRIRVLRDTTGRGVFDKSYVFADNLLWAAGIAPWKGGIFVAAPPDIWYMKDTDGDFKADIQQKVYTGFGTGNQQAMLNNLQFGLDHKIYGSTAHNGGQIRRANDPQAVPVSVDGKDFRFDPSTGIFESITGTEQFGNTFDDWGNRFLCNESQPLLHVVLPQHYLERNPYLLVNKALQNTVPGPVPIYRISPVEHWRHIRSARRIARNIRPADGPGASHHVVDASAGVTVYRGGAYPKEYYGTVFTADAQNNLVHRRVLEPDGVTFKSRRAHEKTEIVRSSDIWFRPVNFVNAPDGTLYCLDMSREILESIHIPLDVVKYLDLTSGRNSGRIYRIAPRGFRSPPPPRLSKASMPELVAALESPHGWWRDTAHRLIYERQDRSIVPALEHLVTQSSLPQARVHALWSLHGLDSLSDQMILAGLSNQTPGVRENAVRLAEPRLDKSPELLHKVLSLANDPDSRVRFQTAFTLGETKDPRAVDALAQLATKYGDDFWMRTAILSSVAESADLLLAKLLKDRRSAIGGNAATRKSKIAPEVFEQLAFITGIRNRPDALRRLLDAIADSSWLASDPSIQSKLIHGVGTGLKRAGARFSIGATGQSAGMKLIASLMEMARKEASNEQLAENKRQEAIQLVGCCPFSYALDTLKGLLDPRQPQSVQIAAVRALSDYSEPSVVPLLLEPWRQYTPEVRLEVIKAMLAREERTLAFLQAADRGNASIAQLDLGPRALLLKHRNEAIRALATKLFGNESPNPRNTVIASYKSALQLAADVGRGEKVFEKNCAVCHQLGPKGHTVGPNLASSSLKDPESLLTHILDPNLYVPPNFIQYLVVDKQGRTFTGVIAAQTATSITLKHENDATDTILRTDIEELTSTGKSMMPEGLEKNVSKQEMADLLAYLKDAIGKYATDDADIRARDHGTDPGLIEPEKK
jgi:putative membrane-bound dehydrogenase-like protein